MEFFCHELALLIASIILGFSSALPKGPVERIVGGSQVLPNELPYQVAVYYKAEFACSGVILDENHVLTSGFCAVGGLDFPDADKLEFFAVAGEHSLRRPETTEQKAQVSQVVIHPGYNQDRMTNDLAVLRLATPYRFNAAVQPILLAPSGHRSSGSVVVSGWGARSEEGPYSDILVKVGNSVISDTDCRAMYTATEIADSMMCLYNSTLVTDTCDRDSGAAVVCFDLETGGGGEITVPYLCGTASWGRGCGREFPAVATEVAVYSSWIMQFATDAKIIGSSR